MSFLLGISLDAAVPFWIEYWRHRSLSERQHRAQQCAQIVAEKGDIIMYRSGRKGETSKAFTALAEGIAISSMGPGGITFMGRKWLTPMP